VREKVIPLQAADLSILPEAELVVVVGAAAGVAVAEVEEEVVEAAQALQRRHHSLPMRQFQSMHTTSRSRLSGENINGRPHNKLLLMDTILRSMRTPQSIPHGSLLQI